MRFVLLSISLLIGTELLAQLEISDSLILTGASSAGRQIINMGGPQALDHGVSAQVYRLGEFQYATVSGPADSIGLTLPLFSPPYVEGMMITYVAQDTNTSGVKVDLNAGGYVDVLKSGLSILDPADIVTGQAVTMVFDGTNFQMTSPTGKTCPSGYAEFNNKTCIQRDQNTAASFWTAITDCGDQGGYLCSWGEWEAACIDAVALGLNDMVGDYEWTDSAGNYSGGLNDTMVRIAGSTACSDGTNGNQVSSNYTYRCCYRK